MTLLRLAPALYPAHTRTHMLPPGQASNPALVIRLLFPVLRKLPVKSIVAENKAHDFLHNRVADIVGMCPSSPLAAPPPPPCTLSVVCVSLFYVSNLGSECLLLSCIHLSVEASVILLVARAHE